VSGAADAVVVGAGPNGLAAAVVLVSAGLSVQVYEAAPVAGGGCRTAELTLPGYRHDVCSAVHPLAVTSPFFRWFELERRGTRLLQPAVAYAHPLDGGRAGAVTRSVAETAAVLGPDGAAYERTFGPLVREGDAVAASLLSSMREVPAKPLAAARFAALGVRSASSLAARFRTPEATGIFAGVAAHSMRRLDRSGTAGVALLLGLLAHSVGWPFAEGGSEAIAGALIRAVEAGGGSVETSHQVRELSELPAARAVLLDVSPRQLPSMLAGRLPPSYERALQKFRYGPGVCKVDWALGGAVPWQAEICRKAGTVHLGGTFREIAGAEAEVVAGRHPERPYVLCAQPGVVDPSRAPAGAQTLWTYCHVPSGSGRDMSAEIAGQIERFAPGFRDLVIGRSVMTAAQYERYDPNYVGGDITGGVQDLWQTLFRPAPRWSPYRVPVPGVYLCSSSTPPGPGVHGRCGELAALLALKDLFGVRERPLSPAGLPAVPAGTV
jgi:phytoene dehydrogenase-like protein